MYNPCTSFFYDILKNCYLSFTLIKVEDTRSDTEDDDFESESENNTYCNGTGHHHEDNHLNGSTVKSSENGTTNGEAVNRKSNGIRK